MKKAIFNFICTLCLILVSCNDLEQYPINKFTDANYWTSEEKASAILNQAYNQMDNAANMFNLERITDNIFVAKATDENTVGMGLADAFNGFFARHWRDAYQGIKSCNILLDNIDPVPMDENQKARMKAEARFIRTYLFFRLTTQYGDVPHFDYQITLAESQVVERKSHAEVVNWVRSELNSIVNSLSTKQQYAAAENGRITKGAAMGLLARTYLYENDWANIASTCKKIMDGEYGVYSLFPDYEGLFLPENEYNSEVLLDIEYIPENRTWDNMRDNIPITAGARSSEYAPTQELVNDFVMLNGLPISNPNSGYDPNNPYVNRDPRFTYAIVYHGYQWKRPNGTVYTINIQPEVDPDSKDNYVPGSLNASQTGYYLRKWYDPSARQEDQASGLNIMLIRYADILLMYAEAMNEQNQMNEQVWNMTIRKIRERAGFTNPDALDWKASFSQSGLREIIRRERRCELAFEGTRLYDLRRWKTAEIVMNGSPTGARFQNNNTTHIVLPTRQFNSARDYLWPIPGSERDINPKLGQNPNW
ncbi:MAG: RagB/SusD family nutrient uptake outer membrane protein [Tannerellaceae bacterium]|jgi:hypothetical protein|nr:RagB/SusD family nutrient uptake outer membrane protein [Tannerellaceae bacterium]